MQYLKNLQYLMILTLVLSSCTSTITGDELVKKTLIGSWEKTSGIYNGKKIQNLDHIVSIKTLSKDKFTWFILDNNTGITNDLAYGSWKLSNNMYIETPESGFGKNYEFIKDKEHIFEIKLQNNIWYHSGTLNDSVKIQEVWKRVN